ncbi:hypothetical protein BH09CHL1_BH09CHL1_24920 [soil metagenome]
MSQRPPLNNRPERVSRRHDRHGGYDLADIYEARLLAQGVTANEFVTKRSAADLAVLPSIRPIRIGRGSPAWDAMKAAALEKPVIEPSEESETSEESD